jgi:steroid delta-isomerase-like uncharacterized protein
VSPKKRDDTGDGDSTEIERSPIDRLGDRWESAWGGGGRDDLARCCTVDVRYEDPLTTMILDGTGALSDHIAGMRRAFPDLRIRTTGGRVSDGRFGCLPWQLSGTHRGLLGEFPPTGNFMTIQGVHYVELRDGLISTARGFFDLYDAAMQLGLLPKRGSLGESALMMLRGFGLRSRT